MAHKGLAHQALTDSEGIQTIKSTNGGKQSGYASALVLSNSVEGSSGPEQCRGKGSSLRGKGLCLLFQSRYEKQRQRLTCVCLMEHDNVVGVQFSALLRRSCGDAKAEGNVRHGEHHHSLHAPPGMEGTSAAWTCIGRRQIHQEWSRADTEYTTAGGVGVLEWIPPGLLKP